MTENLLDAQIVLKWYPEEQMYKLGVSVFDGDLYVASKIYESADALDIVKQAIPFVLYWSRLYFDNPSLTPRKKTKHSLEQLRLFQEGTDLVP